MRYLEASQVLKPVVEAAERRDGDSRMVMVRSGAVEEEGLGGHSGVAPVQLGVGRKRGVGAI